jgi:hypothetical protein
MKYRGYARRVLFYNFKNHANGTGTGVLKDTFYYMKLHEKISMYLLNTSFL